MWCSLSFTRNIPRNFLQLLLLFSIFRLHSIYIHKHLFLRNKCNNSHIYYLLELKHPSNTLSYSYLQFQIWISRLLFFDSNTNSVIIRDDFSYFCIPNIFWNICKVNRMWLNNPSSSSIFKTFVFINHYFLIRIHNFRN